MFSLGWTVNIIFCYLAKSIKYFLKYKTKCTWGNLLFSHFKILLLITKIPILQTNLSRLWIIIEVYVQKYVHPINNYISTSSSMWECTVCRAEFKNKINNDCSSNFCFFAQCFRLYKICYANYLVFFCGRMNWMR